MKALSTEQCGGWKVSALMCVIVDADSHGDKELMEQLAFLFVASSTGDQSHSMFRFMRMLGLTSR